TYSPSSTLKETCLRASTLFPPNRVVYTLFQSIDFQYTQLSFLLFVFAPIVAQGEMRRHRIRLHFTLHFLHFCKNSIQSPAFFVPGGSVLRCRRPRRNSR